MGKKKFQFRFFTAAAFTTIALAIFQQCGMGGEGMSNLGSTGQSPNGVASVSLDTSVLTLSNSATSLTLAGNCNTGGFTGYSFEVSYRSGATAGVNRRYPGPCTSGRFVIPVTFSDVGIIPGTTGQLTLSIIGQTGSGEVLGPQAFLGVQWGASTTGGTTSSTTGGTTSSTTSGSTSGSTTGCTPSCSASRACGSTQDTCGGNTCPPKVCCTPSCDGNRACGSTADTCGGNTCPAKRCPSCNSWQGSSQVVQMSDHRVHNGMNSLGSCQADCESYENVNCCQWDSANNICYVVLSGNCNLTGAGGNMQATVCN